MINNECQRCMRAGRYTPADMVHHKKEVRQHPELALELDNTECLCNPCHNREHPEKLNGYHRRKFDNDEQVVSPRVKPNGFSKGETCNGKGYLGKDI